MDKANIGKCIKSIRAVSKMSQVTFAASLGVSQASLSEIESGKIFPSIECLINLVNKYGVDVNSLLSAHQTEEIQFRLSLKEQELISGFRQLQEAAQEEMNDFLKIKLKRYILED